MRAENSLTQYVTKDITIPSAKHDSGVCVRVKHAHANRAIEKITRNHMLTNLGLVGRHRVQEGACLSCDEAS